jgi:predicted P-loop ATPase
MLTTDKEGRARFDMANINLILSNDSVWHDRFWWDSVRGVAMLDTQAISDAIVDRIGTWLSLNYSMSVTNDRFLERRIKILCQDHHRDLLQEWLASLPPWDGIERLVHWLSWVCLIPNPTAYTQDVSRLLILGPTARIMDPGCQYRYVIILKGKQNIGKSKLIERIAGADICTGEPWSGSLTHDLANKETFMLMQGRLICELDELESFRGTALTKLKAFITSRNDVWIPKFSNNQMAIKRRTVFIGSSNEDEIFSDPTGETRYLPITLDAADFNFDHFDYMRDQLFAESLVYYKQHKGDATTKADWWKLSDAGEEEADFEREKGRQASVKEEKLAMWLERRDLQMGSAHFPEVTMKEIIEDGLGITDASHWTRALQMEAAKAMRALGWTARVDKDSQRKSVRVWRKS